MKLKLNKKGADRINIETMEYDPQDHVFESDDFEGVIMLTVEEAKKWMRILHENAPYLDCLYESSKDDYLFLEEISKRIEQAEMSKQ